RTEDVQADQARTRSDAEDPDPAGNAERAAVGGDVIDVPALGGDGTRVKKCLATTGRGARAGAAEVLVVDEDVLAVGADEVLVVRVDAVSDVRDLDASAGVPESLG